MSTDEPVSSFYGAIDKIVARAEAAEAQNRHLREALETINRTASPNGARTFDDAIRDLDRITDHARAALTANSPLIPSDAARD